MADGHSVEVITGGEVDVLQFYDKEVAKKLSRMSEGDIFTCDYSTDDETKTKTIVKIAD